MHSRLRKYIPILAVLLLVVAIQLIISAGGQTGFDESSLKLIWLDHLGLVLDGVQFVGLLESLGILAGEILVIDILLSCDGPDHRGILLL